ncbi:EscU/YscU/HrcU family type III secretion system export apparatus switch protein [Treponema parvum]|uniref:EscU/YscU/HrcU family type III secretion system export apparatus switch protein n=1 Tax=Treponema parvum TaxID=138851 RepID=A0A975F4R6_9SPIR|nr:EscU/YscU/HrcU family type III secretion system export apparatus switch protein [Treponema parvum]QTQ14357.1 EscU/YscU/HrcU family type III secretion system export apparatus switch protein [Treponema parvum]
MNFVKKAVALRYPENAQAPFITASAKGLLAQRLLKIAEENDVAVVRDDALAEVLSFQEVGSCIPEQTWEIVAKIFAFIGYIGDKNE